MVTLRIGSRVALPGAGAACAGGDAVPDGDFLRADEDVLDEQPQDALAVFDGGGGGVAAQLGEEVFQVADEGEVGVPVGGLGVEGAELAAQVRLAGSVPEDRSLGLAATKRLDEVFDPRSGHVEHVPPKRLAPVRRTGAGRALARTESSGRLRSGSPSKTGIKRAPSTNAA